MKHWLLRHRDHAWVLLVVLLVAALHVHSFGNTLVADDAWFASALERRTLLDFMVWRYQRWSGRVPIEAVLVLIVIHTWVWKLVNGMMLMLLCYSAGRIALAGTDKSSATVTSLAFCMFMLIAPSTLSPAAWWITGSVNYLWPMALGLYGMLAFVEPGHGGNAVRLARLLSAGLAMYNEQIALVLLPLSLLYVLMNPARYRQRPWEIAQLGFMAANAFVVFAAPGSYNRFQFEQALRFPDFVAFDALDKLAIGFGLIFRSVIDSSNLLIAALLVLSGSLVTRSPVGKTAKTLMFATLGFAALGYLLALSGSETGPLLRFYGLPEIDGSSASSFNVYLLSAWSVFVVLGIVAASAAAAWRSRRDCFIALFSLLLGLLSLGALGFSPTAYASGDRIEFVSQVMFLLVALRLTAVLGEEYGPGVERTFVALLAAGAGWRIIQLLS